MHSSLADGVADLRAALTGELITPESPDYDEARRVWNADVDGHPALFVYCESDDDVVAAPATCRTCSTSRGKDKARPLTLDPATGAVVDDEPGKGNGR